MKKRNRKNYCTAAWLLGSFILWTVAVRVIDVQAIGPQGSAVGFAEVNRFIHQLTGVHLSLYTVTDCLSLIPFCFVTGFALLGLMQWIRRKHLLKVDRSILDLGGFYFVVAACYIFFELVIINHRPVLIDGILEASYPSSTTMLVICVMTTALMQFHARVGNRALKHCITASIISFILFMVVGRLISGVHWFSDIIGGILLSSGLVVLYHAVIHMDIT